MKRFRIPTIPPNSLESLLSQVRPLVRRDNTLYYIESCDPDDPSFLWEAVVDSEAIGARRFAVIPTIHSYGYYGSFNPTVAQVLACIPHHLIARVRAFEITGPDDPEDLNAQESVIAMGFHLASTALYEFEA